MQASIEFHLRDPLMSGAMAFTVTKPRIINLHKLVNMIRVLTADEAVALLDEAVRCGALDSVLFLLIEANCTPDSITKISARCETQGAPGVLVFFHQLFPHAECNFTALNSWRFPNFGGTYLTLQDALRACDPVATIKHLLYTPTREFLSQEQKKIIQDMEVDECRHFFVRLLQDWMSQQDGVALGGVFDKAGMVIPDRLESLKQSE